MLFSGNGEWRTENVIYSVKSLNRAIVFRTDDLMSGDRCFFGETENGELEMGNVFFSVE